ncbi:hypothetical protein K2Z83_19090 [Oscillochloris sp. ZM17-4]|uniref:hypothetical protein n=1 Tax=Oscillochloris sp. ZM17-4 TaxID=2866714 RepID=UPI001C73536C|nr:hypothetical protein [Oscillochloris sp. ZM17-4]MBX0329779.1 hypothetical protein [Oscillochloris sp. ZM17-4]
MPTELENSIRSAAEKVAAYIEDASSMEVKTFYVLTSASAMPDLDKERPGAYTMVQLDGDSKTVVPMREGRDGGLELDGTLFEIHERNVATATEYRARVLNALIGLLQQRGGR